MLTIGSVCAGIGGIDLGLEAAGLGPVRWQIEINPFARAVLAKHWPDAARYGDLIDAAKHPEALAPVDIIAGGTPCQDMSLAGRGAGIYGAKSSLWFSMLSLVETKRPRFVVWENVLGSVRRGMDAVVSGLVGAGYEVVGTRLSAADVGAPHRRERVFVVGYLPDAHGELVRIEQGRRSGANREGAPQSARDGIAGRLADPYGIGEPQQTGGLSEQRGRAINRGESTRIQPWPIESGFRRVADGVPGRSHRLASIGNAVVPQCAEVVGYLIRDIYAGNFTGTGVIL